MCGDMKRLQMNPELLNALDTSTLCETDSRSRSRTVSVCSSNQPNEFKRSRKFGVTTPRKNSKKREGIQRFETPARFALAKKTQANENSIFGQVRPGHMKDKLSSIKSKPKSRQTKKQRRHKGILRNSNEQFPLTTKLQFEKQQHKKSLRALPSTNSWSRRQSKFSSKNEVPTSNSNIKNNEISKGPHDVSLRQKMRILDKRNSHIKDFKRRGYSDEVKPFGHKQDFEQHQTEASKSWSSSEGINPYEAYYSSNSCRSSSISSEMTINVYSKKQEENEGLDTIRFKTHIAYTKSLFERHMNDQYRNIGGENIYHYWQFYQEVEVYRDNATTLLLSDLEKSQSKNENDEELIEKNTQIAKNNIQIIYTKYLEYDSLQRVEIEDKKLLSEFCVKYEKCGKFARLRDGKIEPFEMCGIFDGFQTYCVERYLDEIFIDFCYFTMLNFIIPSNKQNKKHRVKFHE